MPTSRPAFSLRSHRTSSRSQYAWIGVPVWLSAACASRSDGVSTSITHSLRGGRVINVVSLFPAELRMKGVKISEQDAGLPLTHIQPGELLQMLGMKAPVADGDTDPSPLGSAPSGCIESSSTAKPRSLSRRTIPSTR